MDLAGCWNGCTEGGVAKIQCFECIIQGLLSIAVRLAGILALVMLVVGGFQWLTAGNDPKKAQSARNTLTWAVVGLVLLILGWLIFLFIKEFTGIDILEVSIGKI